MAIVDANSPQLGGAVAVYYTYQHKDYAKQLALLQITGTFVSRTTAGLGWELLEDIL
jgi:hypothetical protein